MNATTKHALSLLTVALFAGAAIASGQDKGEAVQVTPAGETPAQDTPAAVAPAPPKAAAKIGDTITFDDSTWTVLEAKDLGNELKSNNQFIESQTTEGKFIQVKFKVTNKTAKEERVFGGVKVVDSQGREFSNHDKQTFFLPKGTKTLALEALPSSMSRELAGIYEVPPDAIGLKLQVRSLSLAPDTALVDLGI